MFFEICSLKHFAILTGKHLFWGLFLIKLQAFRPTTFLKRDFNTSVSCGYCKIFKDSFFIEHVRWLLLIVLTTAGVLVFLFRASTWFRLFRSKTYTKRCKNNSLLSRDKTISSLRELIDYVLSISGYISEKH